MEQSEFDKFADEYRQLHDKNIRLSGERGDYFAKYKIEDLRDISSTLGFPEDISILDFGCGVGNTLPYLSEFFPMADIHGADVSVKSLGIVQERFENKYTLHVIGNESENLDNAFDIIFVACVFHHIDHDKHIDVLKALKRMLKRNGLLVIFEHNPLNPLTVHAVNTCPFDENAQLLKSSKLEHSLQETGYFDIHKSYRIFFPAFLKKLRKWEKRLTWCPLGAQYYIYAVNK